MTLALTRIEGNRDELQAEADDRPRLVFVYSDSSGLSRRADGFLAQVLQRRRNHETFPVHRISVDDRPELVAHLGVDDLPAIVVVEGRRVLCRLIQPKGSQEIEAALSTWLH
jgi:thioredoxin-like negative regulator of GroEL